MAVGSNQNSKELLSFNKQVYQVVCKIPKGKVVTYGQVAQLLGKPRAAREVGWALHANRDNNTPCHRVVDRTGRLAPNFAWDGAEEQRRRLMSEGVKFVDDMHVDLSSYLWNP